MSQRTLIADPPPDDETRAAVARGIADLLTGAAELSHTAELMRAQAARLADALGDTAMPPAARIACILSAGRPNPAMPLAPWQTAAARAEAARLPRPPYLRAL